jgi:hypothetical protein
MIIEIIWDIPCEYARGPEMSFIFLVFQHGSELSS